jgi:hypothetical protein
VSIDPHPKALFEQPGEVVDLVTQRALPIQRFCGTGWPARSITRHETSIGIGSIDP